MSMLQNSSCNVFHAMTASFPAQGWATSPRWPPGPPGPPWPRGPPAQRRRGVWAAPAGPCPAWWAAAGGAGSPPAPGTRWRSPATTWTYGGVPGGQCWGRSGSGTRSHEARLAGDTVYQLNQWKPTRASMQRQQKCTLSHCCKRGFG